MQARFSKAAVSTRPGKAHRFDVYGLKIRRPVALFGKAALGAWISLESDPEVTWYCERPHIIREPSPKRTIDFYAIRGGVEQLQIVRTPAEVAAEFTPQETWPAFDLWCRENGIALGVLDPEALGAWHAPNWGRILRGLAAFDRYVTGELRDAVAAALETPRSIEQLELALSMYDPLLIRTACFGLLHSGKASCARLAEVMLGPDTVIAIP